ncbi:hypothetical protein QAD02_006969 [Eretmocerus hayati]|uniref:Uncharacterized protein n=1 Tax=Eretmocerus hayati TaxID=131215 RepID=A0ACC2N4N7_9HYME|nr:hypothetical protein QAD02_006969 [Eretmocerus hayati]
MKRSPEPLPPMKMNDQSISIRYVVRLIGNKHFTGWAGFPRLTASLRQWASSAQSDYWLAIKPENAPGTSCVIFTVGLCLDSCSTSITIKIYPSAFESRLKEYKYTSNNQETTSFMRASGQANFPKPGGQTLSPTPISQTVLSPYIFCCTPKQRRLR